MKTSHDRTKNLTWITTATLALLASANAFADGGVEHGNGGDPETDVAYNGRATGVDAAGAAGRAAVSRKIRSRIEVAAQISVSMENQANALKLTGYSTPAFWLKKKQIRVLRDGYASGRRIDWNLILSSEASTENPASPYYHIIGSKESADFVRRLNQIDTYDISTMIPSMSTAKLNLKIQMNPQLRSGCTDGLCGLSDYLPLPAEGIRFKVACSTSVDGYGRAEPIEIEQPSIVVRSLQDSLDINVAIGREAAESLRLQYCDVRQPGIMKMKINCDVVPASATDQRILEELTHGYGADLRPSAGLMENRERYRSSANQTLSFADIKAMEAQAANSVETAQTFNSIFTREQFDHVNYGKLEYLQMAKSGVVEGRYFAYRDRAEILEMMDRLLRSALSLESR